MAQDLAEDMSRGGQMLPALSARSSSGSPPRGPAVPAQLVVQRGPHQPRLDLSRPVHCLFGLTFDAVTLGEAAQQLQRDANEQRSCFVSTPNVNFVVAAQSDAAFRDSVLRSDLSLADGMPIVWAARLMGIPIRQRVAGSDLFDHLHRPGEESLKVFFFGGPDGVAEKACAALNAQGGALQCVGFESPGFGSIAEISTDAQIDRINASGADFVVVALGAKKGQAWIEHNRLRLTAPLISHLGAVVNFVAGSVNRAPRLWQRTGLEWLWRVKEEPTLWRRYVNDGKALAKLTFSSVLPCAAAVTWHRVADGSRPKPHHEIAPPAAEAPSNVSIALSGDWDRASLMPLKRDLAGLLRDGAHVQFDLSRVTWLDSALLGLLMLFDEWQRDLPAVLNTPLQPRVQRLMHWHGASGLLR